MTFIDWYISVGLCSLGVLVIVIASRRKRDANRDMLRACRQIEEADLRRGQ